MEKASVGACWLTDPKSPMFVVWYKENLKAVEQVWNFDINLDLSINHVNYSS